MLIAFWKDFGRTIRQWFEFHRERTWETNSYPVSSNLNSLGNNRLQNAILLRNSKCKRYVHTKKSSIISLKKQEKLIFVYFIVLYCTKSLESIIWQIKCNYYWEIQSTLTRDGIHLLWVYFVCYMKCFEILLTLLRDSIIMIISLKFENIYGYYKMFTDDKSI